MNYTISPKVAWQIVPGNDFVYIFNSDTNEYLQLDDIAAEIWIMICKNTDYGEIINTISSKYEEKKENVILDINQFFKEMVFQGILDTYEINKLDKIK